jgi:hypothetical protein
MRTIGWDLIIVKRVDDAGEVVYLIIVAAMVSRTRGVKDHEIRFDWFDQLRDIAD